MKKSSIEHRPRSVIFLTAGLLAICIGLCIFLGVMLVNGNGGRSYVKMTVATIFARAVLREIEAAMWVMDD